MIFLQTSPQLTLTDIAKIETELSIFFPPEFTSHYLQYNGGYPERDVYAWAGGGTTTINTFSSLKYRGFSSVEDTNKDLILLENYLPTGIVPFATDDGGNFFCISARLVDFGCIYYCNNDHYNIYNHEECLLLLERSFKTFIENLSR